MKQRRKMDNYDTEKLKENVEINKKLKCKNTLSKFKEKRFLFFIPSFFFLSFFSQEDEDVSMIE